MFRLVSSLLVVVTLAACSPRPAMIVIPDPEGFGKVQPVFFATTRADNPDDGDAEPDSTRNYGLAYGRADISIPPVHELGQLEVQGEQPNPAEHFTVAGNTRYDGSAQFRRELRSAIAKQSPQDREVVIFVHGFNTNFAEGLFRIAQLKEDFGISGVAVHYSWPSLSHPLGYAYDRDSALFSRDGLESLIRDVKAAGANHVLLVGHSMGGQLSMEALRQLAIADGDIRRYVDAVILISPDIDIDVFRSQATRIGKLPEAFVIFVSERDRALALSARLSGEKNRLGNVDSAAKIADLAVTVIDVTEFSQNADLGHFTVGSSPALIRILQQIQGVDAIIRGDTSGQTGLLSGTILTVQSATEIVLSPITILSEIAD